MRKLALITGGTSGIGFGIAKCLAGEFDLALAYGSDSKKADEASSILQSVFPNTKIKTYGKILKTEVECVALGEAVVKDFGVAPSVLINSSGRLQDALLLSADFSEWKSVIDEHLIVTMALNQWAGKKMYQVKWGRIINLSSISANYAKRGQANYAAAKAGIEAFTRTFALEVAHRGVTVNAIAPGLIETPMTKGLIESISAKGESIRDRIPAGRFGTPEDIGQLAKFLCSNDASYITGTTMVVDGGRSLGDPRS
jgi:3-oxoacyl-[acyl-carrier protein] reductase